MNKYLNEFPIISILRGISIDVVQEVVTSLYQHGVRVIEVPLNRPNAVECIKIMINCLPHDCLIGAGTVYSIEQVKEITNAGAKLIVSPHCDIQLIKYCKEAGLVVLPGVSSATEAYTAYNAGAKWLKLFPATTYGIEHLIALKTVLPKDVHIVPVGGVNMSNGIKWLSSGASAIAIGNHLYAENDSLDEVKIKIQHLSKLSKTISVTL